MVSVCFYFSSFWATQTDAGGVTIAQWLRLLLPSCRPGFESQAHPPFMLLPLIVLLNRLAGLV